MSDSKIVLVTGANSGIGYETVKALLRSQRKYTVLLGGRDQGRIDQAAKDARADVPSSLSSVEPLLMDIESDESIEEAFGRVRARYDRIDALINNAGAAFDMLVEKEGMGVREMYQKTFDVNVSGTNIVTETFLPLLLRSSDPRLIFNTSGMSSFETVTDTSSRFYQAVPAGLPKPRRGAAYQASKAALNMLMCEWNRLLKEDGVKVWCVSPGFLATNLGRNREGLKKIGAGDPGLGGRIMVHVVEGEFDGECGKVVREYAEGKVQPW